MTAALALVLIIASAWVLVGNVTAPSRRDTFPLPLQALWLDVYLLLVIVHGVLSLWWSWHSILTGGGL
ncbi:MAG: hypothetical protein AAF764_00755 [Pseudomonadota bacterium]